MNTKIEISLKTVLFVVAVVVGAWLLFQIRDILYLLFVSFLLMTAIYPLVQLLERIKIPRIVAILIIYALIFGLFGLSLFSSIPSLIVQSTHLAQELPGAVAKVLPYWNVDFTTIFQQLTPIGENVINVTLGIFSNIIATFTVLVFTFYLLLERRHTKQIITDMFGETIAVQSVDILKAIETRLGAWVRGELILMLTIGILVYIGLIILRVDFALPIALVAALLEIVPNIGPIISAIPAIIIGFATSPLLALSIIALYVIVHQVEGNIVVPIVMKRSVGLSPLITILALLVGGKLAGITGAVLAVPVLLVCQVLMMKLLIEPSSKIGAKHTKNLSKT